MSIPYHSNGPYFQPSSSSIPGLWADGYLRVWLRTEESRRPAGDCWRADKTAHMTQLEPTSRRVAGLIVAHTLLAN